MDGQNVGYCLIAYQRDKDGLHFIFPFYPPCIALSFIDFFNWNSFLPLAIHHSYEPEIGNKVGFHQKKKSPRPRCRREGECEMAGQGYGGKYYFPLLNLSNLSQ